MKRILRILFIAAVMGAVESVAVAAPLLETQLSCETNAATSQDTILFTWQIKNTGDTPVRLLNHFAYASQGPLLSLQFSQEGQNPVTVEFDMRDCITWGTQASKILTLKPKQTFQMKARANLKAFGSLTTGKYKVTAVYEPKFWPTRFLTPDIRKELNITPADIWNQTLKSNAVEITIKEKKDPNHPSESTR